MPTAVGNPQFCFYVPSVTIGIEADWGSQFQQTALARLIFL
ncbi:hypothetical protein [Coleofasciculus sp. E1-EBD-02]